MYKVFHLLSFIPKKKKIHKQKQEQKGAKNPRTHFEEIYIYKKESLADALVSHPDRSGRQMWQIAKIRAGQDEPNNSMAASIHTQFISPYIFGISTGALILASASYNLLLRFCRISSMKHLSLIFGFVARCSYSSVTAGAWLA